MRQALSRMSAAILLGVAMFFEVAVPAVAQANSSSTHNKGLSVDCDAVIHRQWSAPRLPSPSLSPPSPPLRGSSLFRHGEGAQ